MAIKAILFDLDGTLRDSRDLIWATTEHTLKAHGVEADREDYRHVIYHLNDIHALYPDSGSLDSYHSTFKEYIIGKEGTVFLYEGVENLLQSLQKMGLKLSVVSAARSAVDFIASQGLADYFQTVVSGSDTKEHKPHPEPVFLVTQRLGVRADEAIMVGDTTADIEAGKAAGVAATIGITHGFADREMLEEAGANYIVDSLDELEQVILEITRSD